MGGGRNLLDRRAFGRRRSLIHASILIAGRPPSPCVLCNFSRNGGMLQLSERLELPFRFQLRFHLTGEVLDCELKHVRTRWIGVQFVGPDVIGLLDRALGAWRSQSSRRAAAALRPLGVLPRLNTRELRKTVLARLEEAQSR
jgi:hypothetical protein